MHRSPYQAFLNVHVHTQGLSCWLELPLLTPPLQLEDPCLVTRQVLIVLGCRVTGALLLPQRAPLSLDMVGTATAQNWLQMLAAHAEMLQSVLIFQG